MDTAADAGNMETNRETSKVAAEPTKQASGPPVPPLVRRIRKKHKFFGMSQRQIAQAEHVSRWEVRKSLSTPKYVKNLKKFRHTLANEKFHNVVLATKQIRRTLEAMEEEKPQLTSKDIRDLAWLASSEQETATELIGDAAVNAALEADVELAALAKKVLGQKLQARLPHAQTAVPPAPPNTQSEM